ncbi:glycosyltransferase [Actinoplanes awajinensis]|nr:glycosyltransferase [Actinoplanes awajinensis]
MHALPSLSVVIPTYNRCGALADTLESLALQRTSSDRFEVIVSDDGSTDATFDLCRAFRERLPLRYRYQQDVGYRAGAARNGGARLAAAPLLAFLDAGTLASPDLVEQHLRAHARGPATGLAVAGYAYGYRLWNRHTDLAGILRDSTPEAVVARHGDDPAFWDWRHEALAAFAFDLSGYATPWQVFWTMNCSVRAEDFWRAGGFRESYARWGLEDIELGLRLFRAGVPITFSREAWSIESPHERDVEKNLLSNRINLAEFVDEYRDDPLAELTWAVFTEEGEPFELERVYRDFLAWTRQAREVDVRAELSPGLPVRPGRLAVIGCGAALPADLPDAELFEFDETLEPDTGGGRHQLHRAIGLRTPLPPQSMDLVVVTSRLDGLRDRWGDRLLAEAHRIGRRVIVTPAAGPSAAPGPGPAPALPSQR